MKRQEFKLKRSAILMAAMSAAFPIVDYAAPAARVDFAVGDVTAVNAAGQARALTKGAQIDQGETVNTNTGRAQLRFTDGAYVSLQPQSEFRIDQYQFAGKQDGSEKGLFSLLKGGLRTITGFIGRTNKKNYQISTTVATIGIRGTEYTIQYGKSITGTVGEGEIEVCNGAGCLNVTSGESYYVQSQDRKPQLSNKRTDLPPPPPQNPPIGFEQQNQTNILGQPLLGLALLGTQTLDFVQADFCQSAVVCLGSGTGVMVFDSNGKLVSFNGLSASNVQMGGNDGIMAWGSFEAVTRTGVLNYFAVGLPVPSSDLTALGGTTGSYTLIGATPVTNALNQTIGSLNSATLTVTFGPAAATANAGMNWTINGAPVTGSLSGSLSGSTFSMFGSANCGISCAVSASGALFGPNAVRAGMAYSISDPTSSLVGAGAAAFAKQ